MITYNPHGPARRTSTHEYERLLMKMVALVLLAGRRYIVSGENWPQALSARACFGRLTSRKVSAQNVSRYKVRTLRIITHSPRGPAHRTTIHRLEPKFLSEMVST